MSREAKEVLFSGTDNAGVSNRLNSLAKVAERVKIKNTQKNTSNTASHLIGAGVAIGGSKNILNTVTGLLGAKTVAKKITDPKFLDQLTKTVEITSRDPGRLNLHLSKLAAIAAGKPGEKEKSDLYDNLKPGRNYGY